MESLLIAMRHLVLEVASLLVGVEAEIVFDGLEGRLGPGPLGPGPGPLGLGPLGLGPLGLAGPLFLRARLILLELPCATIVFIGKLVNPPLRSGALLTVTVLFPVTSLFVAVLTAIPFLTATLDPILAVLLVISLSLTVVVLGRELLSVLLLAVATLGELVLASPTEIPPSALLALGRVLVLLLTLVVLVLFRVPLTAIPFLTAMLLALRVLLLTLVFLLLLAVPLTRVPFSTTIPLTLTKLLLTLELLELSPVPLTSVPFLTAIPLIEGMRVLQSAAFRLSLTLVLPLSFLVPLTIVLFSTTTLSLLWALSLTLVLVVLFRVPPTMVVFLTAIAFRFRKLSLTLVVTQLLEVLATALLSTAIALPFLTRALDGPGPVLQLLLTLVLQWFAVPVATLLLAIAIALPLQVLLLTLVFRSLFAVATALLETAILLLLLMVLALLVLLLTLVFLPLFAVATLLFATAIRLLRLLSLLTLVSRQLFAVAKSLAALDVSFPVELLLPPLLRTASALSLLAPPRLRLVRQELFAKAPLLPNLTPALLSLAILIVVRLAESVPTLIPLKAIRVARFPLVLTAIAPDASALESESATATLSLGLPQPLLKLSQNLPRFLPTNYRATKPLLLPVRTLTELPVTLQALVKVGRATLATTV